MGLSGGPILYGSILRSGCVCNVTVNCEACTLAMSDPRTGHYRAECTECDARALARTPQYADAAQADELTVGYRHALQNAFGAHWRTAHVRVKAWADRIQSFATVPNEPGAQSKGADPSSPRDP
jgi:hypothetical protein